MTERRAPEVSPPEQRLGFLIYRAGVAIARAYEDRMRPSGFTPGEVGVLTHLAANGTGHMREIARALGVSPQTVVNLARALEGKDMVRRAASPSDRRAVLLEITSTGLEALAAADAIARAFDSALETLVGADAVPTVRALRAILRDPASWSGSHEDATTLSVQLA